MFGQSQGAWAVIQKDGEEPGEPGIGELWDSLEVGHVGKREPMSQNQTTVSWETLGGLLL